MPVSESITYFGFFIGFGRFEGFRRRFRRFRFKRRRGSYCGRFRCLGRWAFLLLSLLHGKQRWT